MHLLSLELSMELSVSLIVLLLFHVCFLMDIFGKLLGGLKPL